MKVRELMTAPAVTVGPTDRVARVAHLMVEGHVSGLPVVDSNGKLLGLVTQEDIVTKHANVHTPTYLGFLGYSLTLGTREVDEEMRRVLAVTASDLMSEHVASVAPDADIDEAATQMVEKHVNPLPVVENGRVVGVISHADILKLVLSEEEDGDQAPG